MSSRESEYQEPAAIVIAERHKFQTASQGESESVSELVMRLKKLTSTCSFGAILSQALRDRLVPGLRPKMFRTPGSEPNVISCQ